MSREAPPERIGDYRIVEVLGAGGMGVVYRAEHVHSGRGVALKTVQIEGEAMLAAIRREVHALRSVDHPGVVRIVDDGATGARPWYAMELLGGATLRKLYLTRRARSGARRAPSRTATPTLPDDEPLLAPAATAAAPDEAVERAPPPDLREALSILRTVCAALAHLHGRGIVHRDLKPDNVLLVEGRGPVIVDFGIALRSIDAHNREVLEAAGRMVGSPAYMAPEQVRGDVVDARADLYAVGVMLFETLTGRPPFEASSAQSLAMRKLHDAAPDVRTFAPWVRPTLADLVASLLARSPRDRVGYADVVAESLAEHGAELLGPPGPPPAPYLYRPDLAGRGADLYDLEEAFVRASFGTDEPVPPARAVDHESATRLDSQGEPPSAPRSGDPADVLPTLDLEAAAPSRRRCRGSLVLLAGESGVGKTRLAVEATSLAARRGFTVVTTNAARLATEPGTARSVRAAPLSALRGMLLHVADRLRSTEVAPGFGRHAAVLAAYEPALADFAEGTIELGLDAEASRFRVLEALGAALRLLGANGPALVVLDDLQWADEHTLAFLARLDEAFFDVEPIVVLGTYRLEEAPEEIVALGDAEHVRTLRLTRLDASSTSRLVADMLATPNPDEAMLATLHQHTEGNPFFVAEYLRAAIARGLIQRDARGAWRASASADSLSALPLPRSLVEVVALRLDGLGADATRALRAAAVLGREVALGVLCELLGWPEPRTLDATAELSLRHVVDDGGSGDLRFLHDKVREVAYAAIPTQERRALHARAAEVLERAASGKGARERVAAELAHHLEQAGDLPRALAELDLAIELAVRSGASADALRLLARATTLSDAHPGRRSASDELRRTRWERLTARAHQNLGHLVDAERHGREVLRRTGRGEHLLTAARHPDGAARVAVDALRTVATQLARHARGLVAGPPRARPGAPVAEVREATLAAETLSETYFFLNDSNRAALAGVLAANYAEELGASPELARSLGRLVVVTPYLGVQALTDSYAARAERVARAVRDRAADLVVSFMVGYSAFGAARFALSRERLEAALRLARELGDVRREEETLALLPMVDLMRGDPLAARDRYLELRTVVQRSGNLQGQIWHEQGLAYVLARTGRHRELVALGDRMLPSVEAHGSSADRLVLASLGRAYVEHGRAGEARRFAAQALDLARRHPAVGGHLMPGYSAIADTFLLLHGAATSRLERRALHHAFDEASGLLAALVRIFPIAEGESLRVEALGAHLAGRRKRALELAHRAIEIAERRGMPYEAGLARDALARAERGV